MYERDVTYSQVWWSKVHTHTVNTHIQWTHTHTVNTHSSEHTHTVNTHSSEDTHTVNTHSSEHTHTVNTHTHSEHTHTQWTHTAVNTHTPWTHTAVKTHTPWTHTAVNTHIQWTHTHTVNTHTQWTHTHTVNTHSSEHTQQWTHTAVGSHLCCGARGAVGGSMPCSRAPRRGIKGGERALYIHSPPTYNPCRTWDSILQPLDYESDSLTIRPRLPHLHHKGKERKTLSPQLIFMILLFYFFLVKEMPKWRRKQKYYISWMYIYWIIHYFVEGPKWKLSPEI